MLTQEFVDPMLPPKVSKPTKTNTGVYVEEDVLFRAEAIAEEEGVKSRNQLLGSFLTFAVDLFPLLKPLRPMIQAFADEKSISYAEAVARLVDKGLKVKK